MRVKAAFIIVSIVFIITAASYFLNVSFTRQNLTKIMQRDLSLALDIADNLVSTKILLLQSDATVITERLLNAGSREDMAKIMESQTQEFPDVIALAVLDKDGIIASYGRPMISAEENSYVQKALGGEKILSTTHCDSETGDVVFFLFVPMKQDRVLVETLRGMIFSDFLSKHKLWQDGNIFMVDKDGTIIAHYHPELVRERYNYIEEAKKNPELETVGEYFQIIISSDEGTGTYNLGGLTRLSFHKLVSSPDLGWHIAVAVYLNESPEVTVQKGLLFSSLVFIILGIIVSVIFSGFVVRPFYKIEEQNRSLVELNENAQAASEAKSIFLANMSHEMRTPLNAIIGLSELALGSGKYTGDTFSDLEKISNAGMTLLSIVNNILDISKIEAGKFEIIPVEYDVPNLLNDTIAQSIMQIGEKPVQFVLDISEDLPMRLFGDDLRVKQMLNNLLSNAFKYTNEGTVELKVSCVREGEAVWLIARVSDTGIGIRSKDVDHLFTDYVQIDTLSHRKIEGTGLGLPITKRIAELMEGTVTVESEYAKGSIFTVRIKQKFVTDAVIGAEVVNSLKNFRYSDQKRRENSRLIRNRLPYARVLVVDDVLTNLDVVMGMMKPYGMQIDCVTSGQQAIEAIQEEKVKYNAIFMDHMMPGMDGIEAVRIIREEIGTEYAKTVPIIALTANAVVGNEEMFLSKGFQAFISKPIEIDRLDAVIRKWVEDKELEETPAERHIWVNGQLLPDIRCGEERRIFSDRRSGADRRILYKSIPGIDTTRGLERFGGDEDSYLQVLRSYAVNTRPLLELSRKVSKDNLADYAVTVHGIKGSSWGICANTVGDKAEALEKAARERNYDFVTANNASFIESVEELIGALEDMLQQTASDHPKPQRDKPDREVLSRLLVACEAYDMDGVDAAMEEIEDCEYESDDGLVAWLRENVDHMNLGQIKERLSAMAELNGV